MSVPIKQIWADYILSDIEAVPSLFTNGFVQIDSTPVFRQGDTHFRIPYLKDLNTVAGDDDRITSADGMKLSTARADGYVEYGPVLARGKGFEDRWLDQSISGEDMLLRYGTQLQKYIALRLQATFVSLLKGTFGDGSHAGVLTASHQHGSLSNPAFLTPGMVTDAKAAHSSADGGDGGADGAGDELVAIVMHPLVHSDLINRTSVVTSLSDGTASSAYTQGKVDKIGGSVIIESTALCQPFDNGSGTLVYPSYLMAVNAFYLGFQREVNVWMDEIPLENGRRYLWSYAHSYCPHLPGVSWTGTSSGQLIENPARTDLETVGNWTKKARDFEIDCRRIITTLS